MIPLRKDDKPPVDVESVAPEHVQAHPVFSGGRYGLMSADAPRFPVKVEGGAPALEERLKKEGLKYEKTVGMYDGPEHSFIIHNPSREQMLKLGSDFGQESVIWGAGGNHEFHYTSGPNAGMFVQGHPDQSISYYQNRPQNFWTAMPNDMGFFRLNFDPDWKLRPGTELKAESVLKAEGKPKRIGEDLDRSNARKLAEWWNANHVDNHFVRPSSKLPAGGKKRYDVVRESVKKEEEDTSFNFGANAPQGMHRPDRPGWVAEHTEKKKVQAVQRLKGMNRQIAEIFLHYANGKVPERPNISPDLERHLGRHGIVDPKGFPFEESGRDMRRRIPGPRRQGRGEEPRDLNRFRLMNQGRDPGYVKAASEIIDLVKGDVIDFTPNQGPNKRRRANAEIVPLVTPAHSVWDAPGDPDHEKLVDPQANARARAGVVPHTNEPKKVIAGIGGGKNVYDYTHLLSPEQQQSGLNLFVHHQPGKYDDFMHLTALRGGQEVGRSWAYPSTTVPQVTVSGDDGSWADAARTALRNHGNWVRFGMVKAELEIVDLVKALPESTRSIETEAQEYAQHSGIPYQPSHTGPADDALLQMAAHHYQQAPHTPNDPQTKAAYDALKAETLAQYQFLKNKGYTFHAVEGNAAPVQMMQRPFDSNCDARFHYVNDVGEHRPDEAPYENNFEKLYQDIDQNRHLYVFTGGEPPADHPLAEPLPFEDPLRTYNNVFRAVHDIFGHALGVERYRRSLPPGTPIGLDFGHHGEDHAYRAQSAMYSPLARRALASETRGQNSVVHFGPHAAHNRANPSKTIFPEQKALLLPPHLEVHGVGPTTGSNLGHQGPNDPQRKSETMTTANPLASLRKAVLDKLKKTEADLIEIAEREATVTKLKAPPVDPVIAKAEAVVKSMPEHARQDYANRFGFTHRWYRDLNKSAPADEVGAPESKDYRSARDAQLVKHLAAGYVKAAGLSKAIGSPHMEPGVHENAAPGAAQHAEPGGHEMAAMPMPDAPPASPVGSSAASAGMPTGDIAPPPTAQPAPAAADPTGNPAMQGPGMNAELCPLCGNPDVPGQCTCLPGQDQMAAPPAAEQMAMSEPTAKNATMGYGMGAGPNQSMASGSSMAMSDKEPSSQPSTGVGTLSMNEEMCKACGKAHDMSKKCSDMGKADDYVANDGSKKSIGVVGKMPPKGPDGDNTGGAKINGPEVKEMSPAGSGGEKKATKAEPPMAKPPSGKNPATMVPTSKPAAMKAEELSKPPVSEAQRRAMGAAAGGNSTLGIPKKVGKEFIDADKGGKLPATKKQELDKAAMPAAAPKPPQIGAPKVPAAGAAMPGAKPAAMPAPAAAPKPTGMMAPPGSMRSPTGPGPAQKSPFGKNEKCVFCNRSEHPGDCKP